jgi:hypothetical protein
MRRKESKELLVRIRDRYTVMFDADHENRLEAMQDLKFVNIPGWQWEDNMKQERGMRPCYEFNKIRPAGKRVINDMRANRPQGKVRAVEGGDVDTAEINEGLCRNIWNISDADTVIDYASEFQVNAGMGAWRVDTEYADDSAFDQDILIKGIENPFCLFCDPASKDPLKRDAEDWILAEKISVKEFEAKYGDAQQSDFEDTLEFDDDEDWQDDETIRLAEYWWKEPAKKELWKVEFGEETLVVDSESDEARGIDKGQIVGRREVMTNKIMSCVASGHAILEGPSEWAGSMFPFVMVYGEYVVIDGRPYWWGLPRFAKDAQRSYNVARTAISETIAQAPKSVFWATQEQAAGLTDQWATAHKKNLPYMLYNVDPQVPGPPVRMGGADIPIALMQESNIASEEIKAVTGIYDASMGQEGNEKSGRAIYARQQQGEIATFNFRDNQAKAIRRTYEIILDLIPAIYDTERELRILGTDGSEDYVRVNHVVRDPVENRSVRVNDLAAGKYDVTITVGPNFSTLRQEAAETYMQLTQGMPEIMGVAGDLVFKSMDLPYADDIADRLKTLLPPQIQQMIDSDKGVPPEVQQAMQQAEAAMQQVQQHGQLVQAAAAELEQEKSLNEQQKAEIRTALAQLKQAEAEFKAEMAETFSQLAVEQAKLTEKEAKLTVKGAEIKELAVDAGEIVDNIDIDALDIANKVDEILAMFMTQADEVLGTLQSQVSDVAAKTGRKITGGTTRREGGNLVADFQYNDGSTGSMSAVRENGGLRIVPDSEG